MNTAPCEVLAANVGSSRRLTGMQTPDSYHVQLHASNQLMVLAVHVPEESDGEELGVHRLLALKLAGELRERLLLLGAVCVGLQLLRPCIGKTYGI